SLLWRTIPWWLSPEHRYLVLATIASCRQLRSRRTAGSLCRVELQINDFRESDPCVCRQLDFQILIALLAFGEFDAAGDFLAVDGGPQPAEVFDEEAAAGGVPAE